MSGQQIAAELSTELQWTSKLQAEIATISANVTALQTSAHSHSLTLVTLLSDVAAILAVVNAGSSTSIQTELADIQTTLKELLTMSDTVASELATETTDVAALTTAVNAAVAEIGGFAAQLAAAIATASQTVDPAVLAPFDALHTQIEGLTASLTAAVTPPAAPVTPTP